MSLLGLQPMALGPLTCHEASSQGHLLEVALSTRGGPVLAGKDRIQGDDLLNGRVRDDQIFAGPKMIADR